ncbi:hypothetical protein [Mycobacteroides saopaulense]|nr:hypothetical protein [Mycobacteroides saopaulense]
MADRIDHASRCNSEVMLRHGFGPNQNDVLWCRRRAHRGVETDTRQ